MLPPPAILRRVGQNDEHTFFLGSCPRAYRVHRARVAMPGQSDRGETVMSPNRRADTAAVFSDYRPCRRKRVATGSRRWKHAALTGRFDRGVCRDAPTLASLNPNLRLLDVAAQLVR